MYYIQAHSHLCPKCGSTYDCFDGECQDIDEMTCSLCEQHEQQDRYLSKVQMDAVQNNENEGW